MPNFPPGGCLDSASPDGSTFSPTPWTTNPPTHRQVANTRRRTQPHPHPHPHSRETSPGNDSLATARGIHFRKQTSFQEQRHLRLQSHSQDPDLHPGVLGKGVHRDSGELPRPACAKDDGLTAPTCTALAGHLFPPSPFLFRSFFFSTLKTSNFALGMSRMKCHLPIKRETGEKAVHPITHKLFEIKASFRL